MKWRYWLGSRRLQLTEVFFEVAASGKTAMLTGDPAELRSAQETICKLAAKNALLLRGQRIQTCKRDGVLYVELVSLDESRVA